MLEACVLAVQKLVHRIACGQDFHDEIRRAQEVFVLIRVPSFLQYKTKITLPGFVLWRWPKRKFTRHEPQIAYPWRQQTEQHLLDLHVNFLSGWHENNLTVKQLVVAGRRIRQLLEFREGHQSGVDAHSRAPFAYHSGGPSHQNKCVRRAASFVYIL